MYVTTLTTPPRDTQVDGLSRTNEPAPRDQLRPSEGTALHYKQVDQGHLHMVRRSSQEYAYYQCERRRENHPQRGARHTNQNG